MSLVCLLVVLLTVITSTKPLTRRGDVRPSVVTTELDRDVNFEIPSPLARRNLELLSRAIVDSNGDVKFEDEHTEIDSSPTGDLNSDYGSLEVDASGKWSTVKVTAQAQEKRGALPGALSEMAVNNSIHDHENPVCNYSRLSMTWREYLDETIKPEFSNGAWPEAEKHAKILSELADEMAGKLLAELAIGKVHNGMFADNGSRAFKEVDVVISGGGNYDGYALGVSMVLSRLHQWLEVKRWGGTSAGGQLGFELALRKGVDTAWDMAVLRARLGWNELRKKEDAFSKTHQQGNSAPGCFCFCAEDGLIESFLIREVQAKWLMKTYSSQFPLMDTVALGLSCLQMGDQLERTRDFGNDEDAKNAYIATRAGYTHNYKDMPCSDGAKMANTLLFQDKMRDQLIIDISPESLPYVLGEEDLSYPGPKYLKLVQLGIEDGVYFFHHGTMKGRRESKSTDSEVMVESITLCRPDQDVESNQCLGSGVSMEAVGSQASSIAAAPMGLDPQATIQRFVDPDTAKITDELEEDELDDVDKIMKKIGLA